jgi:hypothetical protein
MNEEASSSIYYSVHRFNAVEYVIQSRYEAILYKDKDKEYKDC